MIFCVVYLRFLKIILIFFFNFLYLNKTYIWLVNLTKPAYTNFTILLSDFFLKALRDFCDLYSCGKFGHRKGDLYKIVSKPYLTVSLNYLIESENYGYYADFHGIQKSSS